MAGRAQDFSEAALRGGVGQPVRRSRVFEREARADSRSNACARKLRGTMVPRCGAASRFSARRRAAHFGEKGMKLIEKDSLRNLEVAVQAPAASRDLKSF